MTPDIPTAWLQILQETFAQLVPEYEVLAYGSRVNGSGHATSDLDLVIRHPKTSDCPCPHLGRIRTALSDSNIPILVDVHDWAQLPQNFRQEIERQHTVLTKVP
ncbi:hypothetical protein C7B61_00020 [filamentous cyanobacterium CCP1]|nr:hypothetical protein C7B61_00020 [filamentous cyanobacterium CCP1]